MIIPVGVQARGSVRRRLLITLLGGLSLVWCAVAAVSAWQAVDEVQELLDAHLAQSASLLVAQISHEVEEDELEHAPVLHEHAHEVAFQIWGKGEQLLLHSADAPNTRLSPVRDGYSESAVDGREWRVFSVWDEHRQYLVQVGETTGARRELARELLGKLMRPLGFALPAFGLLVWFAVGRALRPIAGVAEAIARRDPAHLEPVSGAVPSEIAPVVERLNELLVRVRSSLDNERRFTADASHELRTPLAALKTQLQVAQGARGHAERTDAIAKAIAAADRAAHLVQQLLTLARLDNDAWKERAAPVDLPLLARQALADAARAAQDKHIDLALEGEPTAHLDGHAALLAILLRNLLDNAIRYSPGGTAVTVRIASADGHLELAVCDQGPGIAPDQRAKALERFSRGDTNAPGSGLGLSIVARIVHLHGASLNLTDGTDRRGLCVRVGFRATETGGGHA